jgi:DNA-binding NtrC family response regulator
MGDDSPKKGSTDLHAERQKGLWGVPRLVAVSGPGAGHSLVMASAQATVGRHPTNDLVLQDPRVSAVHLEVRRRGGHLLVRDSGSTNGTWLGPHKVTTIELAPGGEILVGDTLLHLEIDGGTEPAPMSTGQTFGDLVGQSSAMRELFATLARIAPNNIAVLVQGETGTGKEEIARAIHARGPRAKGPFVVIDATSLPDQLAESLLFGHEKGAFTGATERRIGLFEAAHGGTVFLDEVGELPPALQAKFLRVLERREFNRVGGNDSIKVDVRIIAATHRDLRLEIDAKRFREDLYFRIATLRIQVPPLRDRPEDVPLLCGTLLAQIGGDRNIMIERGAIEHLVAQPWPGNVRELRNVLSRAAALCTDGLIQRADVAGQGVGFRGMREERAVLDLSGKFGDAKDAAIERFESSYLTALMKRCGGNLSKAAREADVARHHLRDLLKKRGLYGVAWSGGGEPE